MSDYQDATNDDFDEEDTILDEEVDDIDDLLADEDGVQISKTLAEQQEKILSKNEVYSALYSETYQTPHYLTKYEKAHIIGVRAQMIADGAPMFVDPGDLKSPIEIARKEYTENKIPLLIRRPLPGFTLKKTKYEVRRFSDLQKF